MENLDTWLGKSFVGEYNFTGTDRFFPMSATVLKTYNSKGSIILRAQDYFGESGLNINVQNSGGSMVSINGNITYHKGNNFDIEGGLIWLPVLGHQLAGEFRGNLSFDVDGSNPCLDGKWSLRQSTPSDADLTPSFYDPTVKSMFLN